MATQIYYVKSSEAEFIDFCTNTITPAVKANPPMCVNCPDCACQPDKWSSTMSCWSVPKQRTENTDWVVPVSPNIDNTGFDTVEIDPYVEWPQEEL